MRLSEIDPVFFETSYYVVPEGGGEKPYAILFEALKETQHVALARVGMYGCEHVVIVRPGEHGILAHTMFLHRRDSVRKRVSRKCGRGRSERTGISEDIPGSY